MSRRRPPGNEQTPGRIASDKRIVSFYLGANTRQLLADYAAKFAVSQSSIVTELIKRLHAFHSKQDTVKPTTKTESSNT